MSARDNYRSRFPECWENLQTDPHLSDAQRTAFLDYLESVPGIDVEQVACRYFYNPANCLLGSTVNVKGITLGRIASKEGFLEHIENSAWSVYRIDKADARALFDDLIGFDQSKQMDLLKHSYPVFQLSPHNMWSFKNDSSYDDPFEAMGDLPCRLGLPRLKPPYVGWGHALPDHIAAHIPTAFDAGIFPTWHPGGTTKPLATCPGESGLGEYVHQPTSTTDVLVAFREIS